MSKRTSRNTQMFALKDGPPPELAVDGRAYRLKRVFKHDFWAATCLYELARPAAGDTLSTIVVKFGRNHPFCGLPIQFYGRWLAVHECGIYARLAGLAGLPQCLGMVGQYGIAIEYVDSIPLDHASDIPEGFFDRLRAILDSIHARGVAYCDANKKSNILIADCKPVLIDFQISIATRDQWPWPLRQIVAAAVRYMAGKDLYHLYKHKRKLSDEPLSEHERALAATPGGFHKLHRKLTKPYRSIRRRFLRSQHSKGLLASPTEDIEDHYQPEKETWRAANGERQKEDK